MMHDAHKSPRLRSLVLMLVFEGGLVILAYGLGWILRTPPDQYLAWTGWSVLLGLAATLPLLLFFGVGYVLRRFRPFRRIEKIVNEVLVPVIEPCTWLDLCLVAAVAGIGEELLFRGVMQQFIADWTTPWTGLLIASVLFGLAHLITPTYAIATTLAGLFLGWTYVVSGNLAVPIIAHGVYDAIALIILKETAPVVSDPIFSEAVLDEEVIELAAGMQEPSSPTLPGGTSETGPTPS